METQSEQDNLFAFSIRRDELLTELDEKREAITRIDGLKEEIRSRNEELEAREREENELLARLANELTRLEMSREQTEAGSRQLFDRIWDDYQLTYQLALEYPRLDMKAAELQREERQVRNEMSGMGDVNVSAIEEYKTVDNRYRFMAAQRDDILRAEEKLEDILRELTSLMEKQFQEQFTLISENFGIVFKEMFGGGKAFLRLSDESNILESGIELIAQPPGKTLQNMSLLSGGERALTATALLFGILRMKPSPFCVLDEIEAALDDANVIRFAHFLKSFSGTQFIIITHRKGTMEAADVLYGVTMQEQGISKLVSVKFSEGEQAV